MVNTGRTHLVEVKKLLDGDIYMIGNVYQKFVDINEAVTAMCGGSVKTEITRSVGLSESEALKFGANVRGKIGTAFAELESSMSTEVRSEVNWTLGESVTKSFSFEAPKCGSRTDTYYQLCREYELVFFEKKQFKTKQWFTTFTEKTGRYHVSTDIVPFEDECNCDVPSDIPPFSQVVIQHGSGSSTATVSDVGGRSLLFAGGKPAVLEAPLGEGPKELTVKASVFSEGLRFLAQIPEGNLNCNVLPVREMGDRVFAMLGEGQRAVETAGVLYEY